MTPKITVLMPVYNGERFLKRSIESVLNQTFDDYEFLIIDDKSNDSSKNIISSYRDKRIRFVENEKNAGQMGTLNIGVGLSRGGYIARMDQDDVSLPDRFKKEVKTLDMDSSLGLVYSDSFIVDEDGNRKARTFFDLSRPYRSFIFDRLMKGNFIAGNTVMMRRGVFETIGLYNTAYKVAAEYDLYLRLARRYKVDFIDEPLAEYRVHRYNASADIEKITKEVLGILKNMDRRAMEKVSRKIADRMISRHSANLAVNYLFQHNRPLCVSEALTSLRIYPFNAKAAAALIMASIFPDVLVDGLSPFRQKRFE